MSTIECTDEPLNLRESVTTISANARIDYILRFSKHTVLVIDDNTDTYTQVGNEFLGSLSKDHNAAFVSLSAKLNDIQIRCRIIEQLFGNTLFDPEQPLSVNIVKLAETKNEAITVVISNAEHLSLQLSHELCQLAAIAKKLNKTINVLLLGKTQAAKNLSNNKHLFDNKMSILLASSGQLISWNSSHLKDKRNYFMIWSIIFFVVVIVLSTFIFLMPSNEMPSSSSLDKQNAIPNEKGDKTIQDEFVKVVTQQEKAIQTEATPPKVEVAAPVDVYAALVTFSNPRAEEIGTEQQSESVDKSEPANTSEPLNNTIKKYTEQREVKSVIQKSTPEKIDNDINGKYYQSFFEGYVIQVGNFTKEDGFNAFINTYKNTALYGYAREVKGNVSYVVTTAAYKTIEDSKNAMKNLPTELRERSPWIKTIQAVNNEINLYKQSQ